MNGNVLSDKDLSTLMTTVSSTGIFVTCGLKTPNIMVAHWGTVGKMWGRPVFTLPIRSNKYSYRIVSETKSFVLNVPARDMRTEISLCDTISGFKQNKFETLNLHPKRARSVEAYVLGECGLIVECKVIAIIPPEGINRFIDEPEKSERRPHSLFVGEMIDSYKLR